MSQIVKVEVCRYDYPFFGEFKFFKPGPDGITRRPTIIVRLTDSDGYQGWGQSGPVPSWSYETPETVESTLRLYLAQAILGADPEDLAEVHRRMNFSIKPSFSVGQPICKAAIDLACYDLIGKRAGRSVSDLLGGAKIDRVKLSWTIASPNLNRVEQQLDEGRAKGYSSFNIKVGPPQTPSYDLELIRKVREFAPQGFLWADANTGFTDETALEMAPRLAEAGLAALESPLPPTHVRGYQALKRQGALPIIMDEGLLSPAETGEFIALGMMDGAAMKVPRCAGLWNGSQIINLLRENGLMVLGSGLTDPDLSLAASIHLYAWAGIEAPCALNGPQYLQECFCSNELEIDGDLVTVPQVPGLGIAPASQVEEILTTAAEL